MPRRRLAAWPAVPFALALLLSACGGDPDDGGGSDPGPCPGGECVGQPWSAGGAFGDPCAGPDECHSGLCGTDTVSGASFCTRTCEPGAAEPCPGGARCYPTGDGTASVCGPPPGS